MCVNKVTGMNKVITFPFENTYSFISQEKDIELEIEK